MNTSPAPAFTLMASTRGAYSSSFVFEHKNDFLNWFSTTYVSIIKQYGNIDLRLSALDNLNVGDHCFVAGEGDEEFIIQGWRKTENNRYSFALNNGCWEEVAKCFKNWSRPPLSSDLKLTAQKLGFRQVTMKQNYILLEY